MLLLPFLLLACGADKSSDSGVTDSLSTDTGPTDSGPIDTRPTDTGPTDTGPTDTGPTDTTGIPGVVVDCDTSTTVSPSGAEFSLNAVLLQELSDGSAQIHFDLGYTDAENDLIGGVLFIYVADSQGGEQIDRFELGSAEDPRATIDDSSVQFDLPVADTARSYAWQITAEDAGGALSETLCGEVG